MNLPNILKAFKQKRYNRDIAVFLIFLLVAFFVWFLNKLSHDYLYSIEYPVELYSSRNSKVTFNEKNAILTIQQRMDGFSILKSKVSRTPTIRIDLNPDRYSKVSATPNTYYLLTRNFTDVVDHQIGDDCQLVSINPDTLFFDLGVLAQKKVPVHHQLSITTEKEYMLRDSIVLNPDSVTISGSQAAINEVAYILGSPQTLGSLTQPTEGSFGLLPLKGIHLSDNQVHYSINIIRYTEGIIKIPIRVDNLPPNATITLLPSEVELRYRVAISDFPSIDTSKFTALVSYKDVTDSSDRTLAVQVDHKPNGVLSIHITPPFVEYIIRKN